MIYVIAFLFSVSEGIWWPFVSVHLFNLGANYFKVNLLNSLISLAFLPAVSWGFLSDRLGRKKLIYIGLILHSVALAALGFIDNVNVFISCMTLASFFSSIFYPAYLALFRSFGFYIMFAGIGWSLGALIIGPLEEHMGAEGIFGVSAALVLVCAFLPLKSGVSQQTKYKFLKGIEPEFKKVIVAVFLSWFALSWTGPLIRLKLYDVVGGYGLYGILMGIAGFIGSFLGPFASRIANKVGGKVVLSGSVLVYAMITPLYSVLEDVVSFSAVWLLPIWPFFYVGQYSSVGDERRGEFMGLIESASGLAVALAFVGGISADFFGRDIGIAIATPILFLAFLMLLV